MSLLNKTHVRQLALDTAKAYRPAAKFERVSKEFLDAIESATRMAVIARVKSHPSIGKTLK